MRDVFKGFLVLRLIGLLALMSVVAVVLGIRSLARGSDIAAAAFLAGALVFLTATGSLLVRRSGRRSR